MKSITTIILSVIIFGASFQNSLFMIDYKINQDFYEIHCINKDKPNLACHGKCQMSKNEQTSQNVQLLKICTEFMFLNPASDTFFEIDSKSYFESEKINFITSFYQSPTAKLLDEPPIVG